MGASWRGQSELCQGTRGGSENARSVNRRHPANASYRLLAELGLDAIDVLLVPLERHVAEKLHAYTRTYKGGGTTRARDLADLLLIRQYARVDAALLQEAAQRVFDRRATHPVPTRLPAPPRELAVSYRREAEPVGLARSLDEAHHILADWLNPVLDGIHRTGKIVRPSEY